LLKVIVLGAPSDELNVAPESTVNGSWRSEALSPSPTDTEPSSSTIARDDPDVGLTRILM